MVPGGGGRDGPCNWEGVSGTHAYRMLLPMTSTRGLCGGDEGEVLSSINKVWAVGHCCLVSGFGCLVSSQLVTVSHVTF